MVDSVIAREQEHVHNAVLKGVLIAEEVDILFVPFWLYMPRFAVFSYLSRCSELLSISKNASKSSSMHLNLTREGQTIAISFDTSK